VAAKRAGFKLGSFCFSASIFHLRLTRSSYT
jgi:hypothetical protein